jgi:hypothetical protein
VIANSQEYKEGYMKSEKVTDLKQQLIGLFDKEKVLAFFDFQLVVDQNESVQGLCKISEPKEGEAKSNYLSILFIIDIIDDAMEKKVDTLINGISWSGFETHLWGSKMIIPMPHVKHDSQHYLKGVDIYLSANIQVNRSYIADNLYPAIVKILGCKGNELIFWEELPLEKKHLGITDVQRGADGSLIERIIGYFKGP